MATSLDRFTATALKARTFALVLITMAGLVSLPATASGRGKVTHGAQLPPGSSQVEPGRFRLGMSWDQAVKYYGRTYPSKKYEWIDVVNLPGVKAIHIRNAGRGAWEGLNLYELKGRVRVFVLRRLPAGSS